MEIRILTWNIHKGIGVDRRFRPGRIAEVLRHYEAGVVLLQEVDRGARRSRRLELDRWLAEEAGYRWSAWFENHHLQEGGYGNAVLSKWPIRRSRNVDLTVGRRKRRSALYVRVDLPGHWKDLHVFNLHLGLSARERAEQIRRFLASGTWRHLPRRSRVVLGGDTNDWRNRLYRHAGLERAGFQAWAEGGAHPLIPTYPSVAPVGALDKVFWKGALTARRVYRSRMALARVASDHRPLIADLELLPL